MKFLLCILGPLTVLFSAELITDGGFESVTGGIFRNYPPITSVSYSAWEANFWTKESGGILCITNTKAHSGNYSFFMQGTDAKSAGQLIHKKLLPAVSEKPFLLSFRYLFEEKGKAVVRIEWRDDAGKPAGDASADFHGEGVWKEFRKEFFPKGSTARLLIQLWGQQTLYIDDVSVQGESTAIKSRPVIDRGTWRSSPAGAGTAGSVAVHEGDDWWLPDNVGWSTNGSVISGYSEAGGRSKNWSTGGYALWTVWKWMQPSSNTVTDRSWKDIMTRYAEEPIPEGRRQRFFFPYIHGTEEDGFSPPFLAEPPFSIPHLYTYFQTIPPTQQFIEMYKGWNSTPEKVLEKWKKEHTEGAKASIYQFWDERFLAARLYYHKELAGIIAGHPHGNSIRALDLMGEFAGLWAKYLWNPEVMEALLARSAEPYVRSALDSGIPADRWLMTMGVGGPAYRHFEAMAKKYRTGFGNHGAWGLLPYQGVQHFPNIRYDAVRMIYAPAGPSPYAFTHTDVEILDEGTDTASLYRVFQILCSAMMSIGIDHLLVTAGTIPSRGNYENGSVNRRNKNFDWDAVKNEQPLEYLEWLNRVIGRPAKDSPDAYCSLTQTGTPAPEGTSFSATLAEYKKTGEMIGVSTPAYMKTPLLCSFGRFLTHDTTIPGGKGNAVLKMDPSISPRVKTWEYGDGIYEAKATDIASGNHSLYFTCDDAFAPARGAVVKVTFVNYKSATGEFALEYDNGKDWIRSPGVRFDAVHTGRRTATFNLPDAVFKHSGPGGSDIAIRSIAGTDAAFMFVRVIRL